MPTRPELPALLLALHALHGVAVAAQPEPTTQLPPAEATALNPEPDAPPLLDHVDRGWTFRIEPAYWYAAPRGDIVLPGSVGPVEFNGASFEADEEGDLADLDADNPTGAFLGRLHLARDRWRFSFGASVLSTSGNSTAAAPGRLGDAFFAAGDQVDTDFDFSSFEVTGSYVLFHAPHADEPEGDPSRFRYTLELILGARIESLDVGVEVSPSPAPRPIELGLTAGASDTFAQPIGGARLSIDLFTDFTIEVAVTVGYWSMSSQTSSTWDVLAAFSWRPVPNVGIQLGYRNLGLSATSDEDNADFEFRGSAAGLFAGVIIQF